MADAGRILIIPRGDYDANSTYEKLDLVKYKGTSWLAKKDVTGVEPSEGEYWQNMFDFTLADNLTTEGTGYALDARQGKVLNDKISKDLLAKGSASANANTYTTNGSYMWYRPMDWGTFSFPCEYGVLQVLSSGTDSTSYIAQTAFSLVDEKIYKRTSSNGGAVWSKWLVLDAFVEIGVFQTESILNDNVVTNLSKNGAVKQLNISCKITTNTASWHTLGFLPSGFKPTQNCDTIMMLDEATCVFEVMISGEVRFYTSSALTKKQVYFSIIFI